MSVLALTAAPLTWSACQRVRVSVCPRVRVSVCRPWPPFSRRRACHCCRLRELDCFGACSVQIGDKLLYTLLPTDAVRCLSPPNNHTSLHRLRLLTPPPSDSRSEPDEPGAGAGSGEGNSGGRGGAHDGENGGDGGGRGGTRTGENGDGSDDDDDDEGGVDEGGGVKKCGTKRAVSGRRGGGQMRKKKLKRPRKTSGCEVTRRPLPGETLPTEIIHTYSTIDVMWQVTAAAWQPPPVDTDRCRGRPVT